jgi:glycosyltransferase involved in cell wall biosynthesis
MKILFVTQFFWPESRTAPTNLGALAEDLAKKGHEVLVVTSVPSHPLGKVYDGYRMKLWQWETARGFSILRLPLFPDHSNSASRRLLNYGSFLLSATLLGNLLTRSFQADVIFAYYAPLTMGYIAGITKRLKQVPLIYWITDLWPENFQAVGAVSSELGFQFLRRVEDWSYRQANAICVDSPGFERNLQQKGVSLEKIHVVAEWADETIFMPVERDEALGKVFGLVGKFNIIYGGNLGTVQHLSTVVESANLVQDLTDVQFVFIGDGTDLDNLRHRVAELNLRNVQFIARQPMDIMKDFFAWADALLVHLQDTPVFRLQLPSKVIAYLACGRPILCGVPGAVETVVRDAQAGVFCQAEDPRGMAEQVRLLHAMTEEERKEMGRRGYQTYLKKYTRQVQVKKLENIMLQLQ